MTRGSGLTTNFSAGFPVWGVLIGLVHYQLFVLCSRSARCGAMQLPCKARLAGSAGFNLCAVAPGTCVGSLDLSAHVWDIAAASVILSEAGGLATVDPGKGWETLKEAQSRPALIVML